MAIRYNKAGFATGGLQTYRNINLLTAGAIVLATPGSIYEYYMRNNSASVVYVKFYDMATAATHTDTPLRTIGIPATAAANLFIAEGIDFNTGISVRASTAVADNDATAPSANDVVINLGYR